MALKILTSVRSLSTSLLLLLTLLLAGAFATAGEGADGGLFGEPPPDEKRAEAPSLPPARMESAPREASDDHEPLHFYRRLWLTLDLDYRRRKLRPVKVSDRFEDNVGNSSFDERLDMELYSSEDDLRMTTLGLTLHWRPWQRLEVYAGVRRPLYGTAKHHRIEFDGAPIASPDVEFAHGAAVEIAGGLGWEALFWEEGPLRNFGVWLGTEVRAGWGDDVRSPDDDDEFDLDGNDEVEYDAEWQALDLEMRLFGRFDDTIEGLLTVYAGVGVGWFFYHEEWNGEFEAGDEEERMEFDYREQNLVFGSLGLRAERGPVVVEIGARYGGEYLLHVELGWKF
jgi:hypothetical protein